MRVSRNELLAMACAGLCALGIAFVQPSLAFRIRKIRLDIDTTALPPPTQLRAMTFGYHAAVADLLWATLLVEHGLHAQEHRAWNGTARYIDGILALEKDHPTVYQFVDTLLVQSKPGGEQPNEDDVRRSRAYLERGTEARPYDHEVWLHYGQFLAFLAPAVLRDKTEIDAWRRDGALAIARAVELGADADRSLAASSILSKSGEKKAAIQQLQRAYALTDNADTRLQIILKLHRLEATPDAEEAVSRFEHEWRTRYPFLSRGSALLVGPSRSAAACAGPDAYGRPACPRNWAELIDR